MPENDEYTHAGIRKTTLDKLREHLAKRDSKKLWTPRLRDAVSDAVEMYIEESE